MGSIPNSGADSYVIDGNSFGTSMNQAQKRTIDLLHQSSRLSVQCHWVCGLDMGNGHNLRLNTQNISTITSIKLRSIPGATLNFTKRIWPGCALLMIPYNIQAGRFDGAPYNCRTKIVFHFPYDKPPSVISWLSGLDLGCNKNWRLKTEVEDVTREGFTITFDT